MKSLIKVLIIGLTISLISVDCAISATKTWSGTTSTDWNNSGNWVGGIIADSSDNIVINSNAPNNLILTQNQKITNLTINGDTLDLGGYMFEITGTAYFNGGLVKNGLLKPTGSLCHFGGATLDARIEATCGYFHMNSGVYKKPVFLTSTGAATSSSTYGNHFEDSLTITNNGAVYFNMGSSGEDIFDGPVILYNYSSKEIRLAATDTSYFNNHVTVNASSGGVEFGASGGVSILASGKTISVGTFSSSYLTLTKFIQLGSTAQTLTLSGTGVVSLEGCVFNGNLTINAPGILTKTSSYNGNTTFNRTGSATNFHSYGSNVYAGNVTWDNAGSGGRVRLASTAPDTYMGDATFNSTGGQDLQVAYVGVNTFAGNITINSNKVVFNTNTGKVTFTGTNNQTLNGSYNYPFKKLAINKSTGTVTANTTLSVDDSLIFILGNLITTSSNLLTMKHGSTATGASNSSFVSGPLKKIGNSAFVFNVGSGTTYRPLTITAPSNTSDAFTAEYYNTGQTIGNTKDTTITFVSDCGYWKLDRNVGSSNITPKFAFDSLHCDYLTVKPVHIALWNGTKWTDKGEAVTESINKTTSSAMTSYGYFAFAYDLKPGDAPQMPYPLTIGSACNSVELQFTSNDLWFSFTPDSAVVKGRFSSPDTSKTYAYIKNAIIYNAYQVGDTLETVNVKSWTFDSLLVEFQSYFAVLTPSTDYLLKVTKFDETDGPGVYDSLDYFMNFCLFNLRMSSVPQFLEYSNGSDIFMYLGTLGAAGSAFDGDIIIPSSTVDNEIDVTSFGPEPLIIEDGITFCGNYDLFSESYTVNILGDIRTINTSPTGTLIHRTDRGEYVFPGIGVPNAGLQPEGYVFFMMPRSEIRNIRLRGAMNGFQDYNVDWELCAGIKTFKGSSSLTGPFLIQNCEIFNFSYGGIFMATPTEDCNMIRNYIHHINGSGGATSAKGYATWIQGPINQSIMAVANINNSIFDDSKEGVDAQSNSININVTDCSFGKFFNNEAVVRHNGGNWTYPYPDAVNLFYATNDPDDCVPEIPASGLIGIDDTAEGAFKLNKSIFHQAGKNITFPFPYKAFTPSNNQGPGSPATIFNIEVVNSVFTEPDALPGSFDCNYGGYARIADNYINEPIWDWAKTYDVDENVATSLPPIILNTPNSFSYQPGVSTNSGTCIDCPQPPEVKIGISPIHGYVPGYLSNEPIPFVNGGSNITITTRQDNVGQPNVAFIVRPKTNNGLDSGENNSSGNAFNSSEIVTSPCTGSSIPCTTSTTYTSIPTTSNPYWNTSMPGLYGIDAYAVDKNNKYQSKMAHFPFIIAPGSLETHRLIFNIKDSYYADLYGTSGTPTEIYKQVELNGHKIWQEDIAIGGDDWEYVIIDLFDPAFAPFLDTRNFKNTITFSIAIANKCSTSSVDHRGLRVWVDDVYLQGKDGVENLMKDGSIENSTASGLTTSPTNESLWYIINHSKFTGCFSLDSKYPLIPASAEPAGTEATIAFNERRSGSKSIEIKLDGIHDTNFGSISCNTYCDLTVDDPAPSPLYPDVFISAGFDFDFRDFIDCNALGSSLLSNPYEEFPVSPLDPDYTDKNFIITSNITISSDLQLIGCQLAIEPHDPPYSITIPNNITLELLASSINSTKLFGCSEMWGGIIVQSGGLLNIEGVNARPTEIHDALTGVYNNEGTTFARYAIFDHNYIGMRFENGSHFNASPLTTEGISATEFRCSNGEIKLPPYAGEPSNTHILLENVDEIRIGGINAPNPGGLTNSFTDAVYGIRSINSSFSLYNSEFDRMQNFSDVHPCFTCGAGIYAENTTSGSFEMNIGTKNGLTSTFLKNTFKNSKIGIFTKGNFVLDCDENNFGDLVTGIRSNRNNSSITNHDNNFERVNNGVIVFNSRGNMKINDNTFTTSAGLPPGISFNNTAITIQNPISRFINQEVSVFGNTITDYRIGIHAINIPSPGIGFDIGTNTIAGNEIIYNINNFPLTEYHGGIWLQNCPQARIFDNIISNTDFNADDNFRGIDIWSSVLTDVNCNDITNLGVGISFFDDCRNSQLRSNVITEFNRGVWLNGINGQGMINLVQGVNGTTYSAWDNEWIFNDPLNNTGQFKVDGLVIGGQPINWYHQDFDDPGKTLSPNPWNGSMVAAIELQNTAGASCYDELRLAGDSRIANFGTVIGDSATYGEYSDNLRYLARNTTYKIMKIDTSIINVGDSSDVYFEAFYNQLDSSNTGFFYKIQSLIETIPDSALILIEAMVPENELEEILLAFYQIYFDALYTDDNLSATDSAQVLEWTQGNLALSGEVYFNSLASMFEEKHPELISLRSSGSPSNSVENTVVYSNDNVGVFPNPADQSVTVKMANASSVMTKIQVINSIGKVVATYAPDDSTYLLNLKGIAPGLYFLKIYCIDKEYNKKIQILR